jgi:cytochrome c oxidase subunit 4
MKPAQPLRPYAVTWLALMALLGATYAIANFPLGILNTVASLGIAAVKVVLVALFFMHLRRASAMVVLAALAGLVWLAILFGLSGADYVTREPSPAPWSAPR